MCVGFWTLAHPRWSLIICANRDERLDRPTLAASWHDFSTSTASNSSADAERDLPVLSGIDVLAGGTWLGINRAGRVVFLTNISEPPIDHAFSRGVLVASFLYPASSGQSPQNSLSSTNLGQYAEKLTELRSTSGPADVGGFNLALWEPLPSTEPLARRPASRESSGFPVASPSLTSSGNPTASSGNGDPPEVEGQCPISVNGSHELTYHGIHVSNSGTRTAIRSRPLDSECLSDGMSNAIDGSEVDGLGLKDPWTKVSHGKSAFRDIIERYRAVRGTSAEAKEVTEDEEMQLVEELMELLGTASGTPLQAPKDFRTSIFIPPFDISQEVNSQDAPIPRSAASVSSSFSLSPLSPSTIVSADISTKLIPTWNGTRLSTVILIRRSGRVLFVERDRTRLVGGDAEIIGVEEGKRNERVFRFKIEG